MAVQHSFEPPFFWLFYWSLYFLFTFTFSLLFDWNLHFLSLSYWNLYFFFEFSHLLTFLLKSILFDHFPSEISTSTFWSLSYLYFLFAFLLEPLLSLFDGNLYFFFSFPLKPLLSLFDWNLYFFFSFLLKSLLSLTFLFASLLFFWNLYFLCTFLLKSLLSLYLPIEISTFSLPSYWNLYFLFTLLVESLLFCWVLCCPFAFLLLFTFLLKSSLPSLYLSVEISASSLLFDWNLYIAIETSTFSLLCYWNLYFPFTFSIEISTFSLLFYLHLFLSVEVSTFSVLSSSNLYFLFTFLLKSLLSLYFFLFTPLPTCAPASCLASPTSITVRKAIMPCFPQCNYARKNFKEKICPEWDGSRAETAPEPRRAQRLTPLAFATPCTQVYYENTGIHTLPYFHYNLTALFNCELPLDYSTTWLSYPIVRNYGSFWLNFHLPIDITTQVLVCL